MSPHHHTHAPHETGRPDATRRLGLVLGLTAVYALAEVIGGWLSNSLALLADAVLPLAAGGGAAIRLEPRP